MFEGDRQTGRTTRLLEEAHEKGALFIVHDHAAMASARRLLTHKLNLPTDNVHFLSVRDINLENKLRATRHVVVDHAVWEVAPRELQEKLRGYLALIGQ